MILRRTFPKRDWGWLDSNFLSDDKLNIRIPNGLYLLWAVLWPLQIQFDIETISGRIGLWAWWIFSGKEAFQGIKIAVDDDEIFYELADIPDQDIVSPISKIALEMVRLDPKLWQSFDLSEPEDRRRLVGWYFAHVPGKIWPISPVEKRFLSLPFSDIEQDIGIPITRAMALCYHIRPDLQELFDLSTIKGRQSFMVWWLRGGYRDIAPNEITEGQLLALSEPTPEIVQDAGVPITRAMSLCWCVREDLNQTFNLSTKKGRKQFIQWWITFGKNDADASAVMENGPSRLKAEVVEYPIQKTDTGGDTAANSFGTLISGGVNLVGLAKGELGIGEDLRMASKSMGAGGVEFSIFNFPPSCQSRERDQSIAHRIRDELVYNVNIVYLTGFEHSRLLTQIGSGIFDKRFTIGSWPWELPRWPKQCDIIFRLVDEIWASTKYAMEAYSNSPVPVIHMPMTVDFDSIPGYTRRDIDLPVDMYLFLFVFDGLSYMARKNPIAHIKAFWEAFPKNRKDVGLVIKTMNVKKDNDTWKEFHRLAAKDERIRVIADTFPKDKILGLMNCCDAFVSLHRAEGFGRCIAEMMWLGKPVIVTNFSGNTDFTTSKTAFLVDGPLVPVEKNEYPFGEGQYWCDPDIGQAAQQMRRCFEDNALAEKISVAGRAYIRKNYSAKAVGTKYKERLKKLGIVQ